MEQTTKGAGFLRADGGRVINHQRHHDRVHILNHVVQLDFVCAPGIRVTGCVDQEGHHGGTQGGDVCQELLVNVERSTDGTSDYDVVDSHLQDDWCCG